LLFQQQAAIYQMFVSSHTFLYSPKHQRQQRHADIEPIAGLPEVGGATYRVGVVDVPGHEDFVKNMVAGVGSVDLALLVVAADDRWMPQTEEHLQVLSYLGVFIVLKRMVFVSAALSEISGVGVAFAFYVGALWGIDPHSHRGVPVWLDPTWFSLAFACGFASLFSLRPGHRKLASETVVGLGYIVASALVLTILNSPRIAQEAHAVGDILFGNAVTVPPPQIVALAIAGALALSVHALVFKELLFTSYDPETAVVQSVGVFRYELMLNVATAVVISVATRAVGALPVFAFTVVPAAAALLLTERMRFTIALSVTFGMVSAAVGYYVLSAVYASLLHFHGNEKLPSELGVSKSTAALASAAVFVCLIAPVAEEFFFRGFIFGVLRRVRIVLAGRELGIWVAAVVTGILFGLAHTGSASPRYLVPLGFLGFVLCLVRWRTGSLYPCIALHALNNSLALGIGQLHWNAGEVTGLAAGSVVAVLAVTLPFAGPGRRRAAAAA